MFLLSLCIHIEINSTARIQYLKKKKKRTKLCVHKRRQRNKREKKRKIEQYGISKKRRKNFKTCFSVQIQE